MHGKRIGRWVKRGVCVAVAAALLAGCSGQSREEEPGARNGVYYEIFFRSFADSDGNGIGDFKGLTARLDYLNDADSESDDDLGVDGIWLTPFNASPSYHKYDVTDYYGIDPEYGTMEDFDLFLDEAHKRGIRVIMDLVINHTSSRHPWFKEACKSEDNPYREYYRWAKDGRGELEGYNLKGTSSWGSKVWHKKGDSYYYAIFDKHMPDLNYDNPKVREEIKEIAKFWLKKGVDGFRLDAAMHVYGAHEYPAGTDCREKNLQWWIEFGDYVEDINPNVYLVGEVWDKTRVAAPYYRAFDSLFNFDAAEGIIKAVNRGTGTAVGSKGLASWLEEKYMDFASVDGNYLDVPFLSNHDQNRSMNQLGKDDGKAKLAAGIYMTLPGNPFIYYGEEIGMLGTKPDEMIRLPFLWSEMTEQQDDPDSLLNCYKQLIRLRRSSKALLMGDFKALETGSRKVIAYSRDYVKDDKENESVIVLHNLSNSAEKADLDVMDYKKAKIIYETAGKEESKISESGIILAPRTTVVLQEAVTNN
jgi:alpha-amylase